MRRVLLGVLLFVLGASAGCFTPDDRRQWNEAVKDLRGDNRELKLTRPAPPKATE